jgi:hypothetical protein
MKEELQSALDGTAEGGTAKGRGLAIVIGRGIGSLRQPGAPSILRHSVIRDSAALAEFSTCVCSSCLVEGMHTPRTSFVPDGQGGLLCSHCQRRAA